MRVQQFRQAWPKFVGAGAGAAVAVSIAACGGGTPSPSPSPSPSATSASATATASAMPTTGAAARAAIKQDWMAFFSAKTSLARRIMLLQNGESFGEKVLREQASNPMAASATAQVTNVTLLSPTRARVTYNILVNGQPALTGRTGVAVYQDGVWKVGVASFCGLLTLESGGKTSSLPEQCRSGG